MAQGNVRINFQGNAQGAINAANAFNSALQQLNNRVAMAANQVNAFNQAAFRAAQGVGALANGAKAVMGNLNAQQLAIGGVAKGFLSLFSNARSALGYVVSGFGNASRQANNHTRNVWGSVNAYKGLVGQVVNLNRFLNVTFASIRQIGQGLQNFGTIFSIFISAPITGLLTGFIKEAIDFQHQMIEVRKTTGLFGGDLKDVEDRINGISSTTPTLRKDLAAIAADWGRMGATNPALIAQLTELTDKIVQATDLTAGNAVEKFGRLGTILFGGDLEAFAKNFAGIASSVNELGQANPTGETEIIEAALRFAPAATIVGIPPEMQLAIAASIASITSSPQLGGTETSSAITTSIKSLEKYASLLGITKDEVIALMDTDFASFFLSVLDGISKIESKTTQLALLDDLLGTVGAKAGAGLVNSLPNLDKNIALSNKSFKEAISIQEEYERSLDSVQSQLGILRNNFVLLGNTIGEVVLPYITKFVALAVPALQMLTEQFSLLDERTKLTIVAIAGLVAILGPLIIMIGTLLFSIGIIGTGISTFIANILALIGNIGQFGFAILGLLNPVRALILALGALVGIWIYLSNIASSTANTLAVTFAGAINVVVTFVSEAIKTFQDLAASFFNVISTILNAIVSMFDALSAKPKSALSNMLSGIKNGVADTAKGMVDSVVNKTKLPAEKAGKEIGKTIKEAVEDEVEKMIIVDPAIAMQNARALVDSLRGPISGLSDSSTELFGQIFGDMRSIISAMAPHFENVPGFNIDDWIKEAAQQLVDFFRVIEEGGNASLGGLRHILGDFTDDFENLVKLENDYVKANERLEEIKKSLKNLDQETDDRIMAVAGRTDLTLNERAAMIRKIKLDAAERRKTLEEEKDTAEEEKDLAQDRVQAQKNLINILQSLILPSQQGKPKKVDNDYGGLLSGTDVTGGNGAIEAFTDTAEVIGEFTQKLSRAREIISGFFAGLRGDMLTPEELREMGEAFTAGFAAGKDVRDSILDFLTKLEEHREKLKSFAMDIALAFNLFLKAIEDGFNGTNNIYVQYLNNTNQFVYKLGYIIGRSAKIIGDIITGVYDFFTKPRGFRQLSVLDWIAEKFKIFATIFGGAFKLFFDNLVGSFSWERLAAALWSIVRLFGMLSAGAIADTLPAFAAILGTVSGSIAGFVTELIALIAVISELILLMTGHGDFAQLEKVLKLAFGDDVGQWVLDYITWLHYLLTNFDQAMTGMFTGLVDVLLGFWATLVQIMTWIADSIGTLFPKVGEAIRNNLIGPANNIIGSVNDWNNQLKGTPGAPPPSGWLPVNSSTTTPSTSQGNAAGSGQQSATSPTFDFPKILAGIWTTVGEPTLKIAQEIGYEVAKAWSMGVIEYIKEKTLIDEVYGAMKELISNAVTKGWEEFSKFGTNVGEALSAGWNAYWSAVETVNGTVGSILIAIGTWIVNTAIDIGKKGTEIAGKIGQGIADGFSNVTSFMQELLGAISKWIRDNATLILKTGWDFGVGIMNGIVYVFRNATTLVTALLAAFLRGVVPDWFNPVFDSNAASEVPITGSKQSSAGIDKRENFALGGLGNPNLYMPEKFNSESSSDNMNFYVTISGGNLQDQNTVKYIIDEVYARLSKEMRTAKARG